MEMTKYQTSLKQIIDTTTAVFYFKRFIIEPRYIPEGSFLNNYEGSNFLVEPFEKLSLLQIYETTPKGKLICRTVDMEMKEITLDIKNLLYVNNEGNVPKEAVLKLLGEYVMYLQDENKCLLLLEPCDLWIKTNAQDLKWNKIGLSKIEAIQEGLVWALLPNNQFAYSSFLIFCFINQIDLKSKPESFLGKEIVLYEVNGKHCFKLKCLKQKPEKKLTLESFDHDFYSENEPKLNYKDNKDPDRIQCSDFERALERPEFDIKKNYISPPRMNKNLGSVIGLGILEHLIRFKSDISFRTFIEDCFTNARVDAIYKDFQLISQCKSVQEFHKKIGENVLNIKRIGEGILSVLKNDTETFEGLQELCDIIGCCIHFRNFTEGFKQIKIVPIHYKVKSRPVINLGKYFNDYFLIYSEEMMIADKFLKGNVETKRNFPYYDMEIEKEEKRLRDFINGMIDRIDEIKDQLEKKLSGKKLNNDNLDFAKVANLYEAYFYEKYKDKSETQIVQKLKSMNFNNLLFKISVKKYFCNCGCNKYFEEVSSKKATCLCKKDYSREHLSSNDPNLLCFCQSYRIYDILANT